MAQERPVTWCNPQLSPLIENSWLLRYSMLPFLERTEVILYPAGRRTLGLLRVSGFHVSCASYAYTEEALSSTALDYSCTTLHHISLLYTILRCSTLLYNTMHTLPYPAENDGARTVTLFYHSVWSICLISSTSILLFTTLHNFTLPCVALLYILCTALHHFALLCSTLNFTPLCRHLSCPPTQRIRGRT